ncbi:MAG: RNA-binding S4 domain-containing protein [Gammaproteobacteria bacterium]
MEATVIYIDDPVIELYKLLKLAGFAGSGGEAKAMIASGDVLLDDETETRKRKKVAPGATVTFAGQTVRVEAAGSPDA